MWKRVLWSGANLLGGVVLVLLLLDPTRPPLPIFWEAAARKASGTKSAEGRRSRDDAAKESPMVVIDVLYGGSDSYKRYKLPSDDLFVLFRKWVMSDPSNRGPGGYELEINGRKQIINFETIATMILTSSGEEQNPRNKTPSVKYE
jgi:hypothetical protein